MKERDSEWNMSWESVKGVCENNHKNNKMLSPKMGMRRKSFKMKQRLEKLRGFWIRELR
jgi:hypothetical protein